MAVNARPGPEASPRGWIVTGAMSAPAIAVETKSRPDGSSRNATGAPATSHAASHTADPRVVAAGERARHAADRAHPAGLVAQHVVEAPQVALVALALQLGGQHAREHREQLLVGRLEGAELAAQRAERPDARAVGQLERHAEVGRGGHPLLHREPAVDRVLVDVVAHPRRAVLGHVRAERVAQRSREVRAQAELAALAGVDDPVDELAAVQVGEEERRVRHVALEQVEHGARGVGERAVAGGRGLRGSRDRARVHGGGLSPLATLPKIGYPSTLAA